MILLLSSSSVGNGGRNGRSGSVMDGAGRVSGGSASAGGGRNGASGTPTPGPGR